MSHEKRETPTYKCAGCGHVFNVGATPDGPLVVSDRPVGGGGIPDGGGMGAEGIVIAVVAKGPENLPAAPDEWPAYPCPRCGRLN